MSFENDEELLLSVSEKCAEICCNKLSECMKKIQLFCWSLDIVNWAKIQHVIFEYAVLLRYKKIPFVVYSNKGQTQVFDHL
jgi:hypothetical protein